MKKKNKLSPTHPFRVVLRKRRDGIFSQIKWKQLLICEAPPAKSEALYALAEAWNLPSSKIDPNNTLALKKIQLEAAQALQ